MTVVFVAPDDSDDEELSNCEENNHLKYKFITDETEHIPKQKDIDSLRDLTISNGEQTDTASIDSNQR
jgi:hypothetical protein